MHIINLNYLKDRLFCFTKLLDNGIKELNRILVGLNTIAVILKTNNSDLLDLIDLEAKRVNKKKEKVERR